MSTLVVALAIMLTGTLVIGAWTVIAQVRLLDERDRLLARWIVLVNSDESNVEDEEALVRDTKEMLH